MSERQTLITVTDPTWNNEDQEWLEHSIEKYLNITLPREYFTIVEIEK